MKKGLIIVALLMFVMTSLSIAGEGVTYRHREQPRPPLCYKVFDSEQITIEGTVVRCFRQQGLIVDTAEGQVKIFGLGPIWYWEANGVDRPEVGDQVSVVVYVVPFADATRYIAASIIIDPDGTPESILLRDPDTGCPLWRQ